jgi:hypothetical protein
MAAADPEVKEITLNPMSIIRALETKLTASEKDAADLKSVVQTKNAQIVKLEAENLRLKMTRTDEQLRLEVAGLRKAAGARDKELVDLKRKITMLEDSEKLALRRAAEAERKSDTLRVTLETMQKARDTAQGARAQAEQRTQDAVAQARDAERKVVEADERAKNATKPLEKMLVMADAIIKKSPSLNRNETEVKNYREARKV